MRTMESLGSAPSDEPCVPVSATDDYMPAMRAETLRYKELLEQTFPDLPEGMYFRIARNSHEFGSYLDVELVFDSDREDHWEAYERVDAELPAQWPGSLS